MRIITGKYKGKRFDIPRSFKARPTTDFAKENLFNVLNGYLNFEDEVIALDLFAGTGSITLELLSRGCDRVISVEQDSQHFRYITQVINEIKDNNCFPIRTDALRYLQRCKERFDFIFADPPYALKEIPLLPDMILSKGLLKSNGLFVLEHGRENKFSTHPQFIEHRAYGSVNFSFFRASDSVAE